MADFTDTLTTPADRASAVKDSGDTYQSDMEDVLTELDSDDGTGISVGTTAKAGVDLFEAESKFNAYSGVPKTASKAVKGETGRLKNGN